MKNTSFVHVAAALAITILVLFLFVPRTITVAPASGAGSNNTIITTFQTSTEILASSTASTLLLATSTSRRYAIIGNHSPTAEIFLSLTSGGAAVVNKGIRVPPGGQYEIRDVNLYVGAIYAIASSTSASTTVAEAN